MTDKLDYKKEYKDFYMPKAVPTLVNIPKMVNPMRFQDIV